MILLLISLLTAATACQPSGAVAFPDPAFHHGPSTDEKPTDIDPETLNRLSETPKHLTLALPISAEALELQRLYFLASSSGRLTISNERLRSVSLSLADLQIYDAPLELTLESVSFDSGATEDQLRRWTASASMPDLLYLNSHNLNSIKDRLTDLTDLMASAESLDCDHVYASLLAEAATRTDNYGLPFLISVPLLYADQTFIEASEIELPPAGMNWSDFLQISSEIAEELVRTDQYISAELLGQMQSWPEQARRQRFDRVRLIFPGEKNLLTWLPSQFDPSLGWMTEMNGQWNVDHPAMTSAWQWLTELALSGLGSHHLDTQQLAEAGLDTAETRAERAIFWFDDSSHINRWTRQNGHRAVALLPPAGLYSRADRPEGSAALPLTNQATAPLPVNPRYLAVSQDCQEPVLAGQLALMLATDPAALILQSRIQLYEGFFPIVQQDAVWEMLVSRQLDGHLLSSLQQRLELAPVLLRSEGSQATVAETLLTHSWEQWVKTRREELAEAADITDPELPDSADPAEDDQNTDRVSDLATWLENLNLQLSR